MVAKRSARSERTQTINQARSLIVTGPDDLRARFARHTVVALVAETASLRPRPGSTVGYATPIALRELGRRAEFPGRPAPAARQADRLAGNRARPRPARPVRRRPRHRRAALDRRRGPPRTAPVRGGLGAPVRRRPDPGIVGQDRPPPAQPRRRPPGQPRPMADRDHPDELASCHSRLRQPAQRGRPVEERDHPLPEALRRPRGLPPASRRRWLTPTIPGNGLTR
jgi:hypothetical protein